MDNVPELVKFPVFSEVRKKIKLLEYGCVIHHFEARDAVNQTVHMVYVAKYSNFAIYCRLTFIHFVEPSFTRIAHIWAK